eukprot:2409404-Alexandrium_andersonii.AAC.1
MQTVRCFKCCALADDLKGICLFGGQERPLIVGSLPGALSISVCRIARKICWLRSRLPKQWGNPRGKGFDKFRHESGDVVALANV